jgi:hypothetical protein
MKCVTSRNFNWGKSTAGTTTNPENRLDKLEFGSDGGR